MTLRPTCIDLFAGAGGLAEGFRQAGWQVLAGADHDPDAIETFRTNFPEAVSYRIDVVALTAKRLLNDTALSPGELGCLLGGPPCQSFSYNNHARSAIGTRAKLFRHYLRLVRLLRPKTIVMENVPGMLTIDGGSVIREIRSRLSAFGYEVAVKILFAEDFGVPQRRRRIFIIGTRVGSVEGVMPKGTHGPAPKPTITANPFVHHWKFRGGKTVPLSTVWDAIGDLPSFANGQSLAPQCMTNPAESTLQEMLRRGSQILNNHFAHQVKRRMLTRISSVPEGGNWLSIPRRLLPAGMRRAEKKDHTTRYGRLSREGLACTILTKCDPHWGAYIHPTQDRTLSVREAARLQTFPDRFTFASTIAKQYEQVGNAVPPLLAQHIATSLRRHVQSAGGRKP